MVIKEERYPFVQRTLTRFGHEKLGWKKKGLLLRYLERMTGLSRYTVANLLEKLRIDQTKSRPRNKILSSPLSPQNGKNPENGQTTPRLRLVNKKAMRASPVPIRKIVDGSGVFATISSEAVSTPPWEFAPPGLRVVRSPLME